MLDDHTSDENNPVSLGDQNDHEVSAIEALGYYYGIRGPRVGPKLIYRTSKDIFEGPSGPFQDVREVKLRTVYKHSKLSENNLWDTIRDETAGILDCHQIKFTSIDLVRFLKDDESGTGEIRSGPDENAITIWIGVLPNSTNGNIAFHVSQEILKLLKEHDVDDIGIAFRESVTRPYAKSAASGPILYAPVWYHEPLAEVIEWVTTALSLPISGLNSPSIEGTLGFYFKVGEDLYGVTTRHALFPSTDGNDYTYDPSTTMEKKSVILMGTEAFKNLVCAVELDIELLSRDCPEESGSGGFSYKQDQLDRRKQKLVELKKYSETLERDWSNINDRVIGHVVWSPPISGFNPGAPQSYMRDVCVIELDKTKFLPNFLGNVMDLGGFIYASELLPFLYPPSDEFPQGDQLPLFCFYPLRNILPVSEIKEPNVQGSHYQSGHDLTRFVFKRGFRRRPESTIGALNGFLSRTRRYSSSGTVEFDSIEAAVFPSYGVRFYPFSGLGDSGSAIVGTHNEFVLQLTSGAGPAQTDFCDITYGTPMEWLWEDVIKPKFPDAVLFFDTSLAENYVFVG